MSIDSCLVKEDDENAPYSSAEIAENAPYECVNTEERPEMAKANK